MKTTISKKQKTIIGISVALVLAASGLSNLLETQHVGGRYGNQTVSSNWQISNNPSNIQSNDSSDTWQQDTSSDTWQQSENMPFSSNAGGSDQGAFGAGSSNSDMGSDAVTSGYWERQAIQDGLARDRSNEILDQTTVQNPETGETFQTYSGSDNYYQSPSVDASSGGSGIVGVDAGGVAPSDGTQLSVVTGSDSNSSSTATSGGE